MPRKPRFIKFLLILAVMALAGCDTGWKGPKKESGPVPLSSAQKPITRMVKTKSTIQVTLKEVLWDEGSGPVPVAQRVQPLVDAIPKELLDRLHLTRNVPYQDGKGTFDQTIYTAWGVVVCVNPDVLIVTVREEPLGSYDYLFEDWDYLSPRLDYIRLRLEQISSNCQDINFHAGTIVPWSDELYVISTDPKIGYRRLTFENNMATIDLPGGKLVLRHYGDDVNVSRE